MASEEEEPGGARRELASPSPEQSVGARRHPRNTNRKIFDGDGIVLDAEFGLRKKPQD